MDSWRWRKCATGCGDYVSKTQSTQPLFDPDVSTLKAYLRIPTVYVDKTRFYVVFKITDQYGSPRFASREVFVSLAAPLSPAYVTSLSCQSGSTLGSSSASNTEWLYYCSGDAVAAQFSNLTAPASQLQITASLGNDAYQVDVGGADVALNELTLARTPDWWHATLRSNQDSSATWSGPSTPAQPTVVTTPTYPLYAGELFEVIVYNYETYSSDVYSMGFTANYDSSVVTYVGYTQNNKFATFNEDTSTAGQVTLATTSASAPLNGFFRYATLKFRVSNSQAVTTNSGVSTSITVFFNDQTNNGLNKVTQQHYSSVYDFRQGATYGGVGNLGSASSGGATGAIHVKVVSANDRAAFLHPDPSYANSQDHGRLFNYGSLDGQNHDNIFKSTVVTDRMSSSETGTGVRVRASTVSSCTGTIGSNYDSSVLSSANADRCTVRIYANAGSDTANSQIGATLSGTCVAQSGSVCSGSAQFMIVSPTSVVMNVTDATLNKMRPLASATCSGSWPANSPYQTASISVYADGYDVTSLATGLHVSDSSVADFVVPSGRTSTDPGEDVKSKVRGKAAGSFTLKLYDDSSMASPYMAPSLSMTVSDELVNVTSVVAKVITDLDWDTEPSASYTYQSQFSASVTVSQTMTLRPAGTTRGHYGYLFKTLIFEDGASEEVDADEITVDNQSPNVFMIAPGAEDTHTGSDALKMSNTGTDRWMVTISKLAVSECIETTVRTDFSRCGQLVASGFPTMHVQMPEPYFMIFNISASGGAPGTSDSLKALTPTNGGAAFSPFINVDTITTSSFKVTVLFDDGSSVDTYAEEEDSSVTTVVFYSLDESCATVDNAVNTVTVVEGAACDFVEVGANVTVNGVLFQGVDTAPVVRLASVQTLGQTYPAGTGDIKSSTHIYRLPCGADYERHTLTSWGTLSTDVRRQIGSADITYNSTDPSVVVAGGISGTTVQVASPVVEGSGSFGSTCAEFYVGAWQDCANITLSGLSFTVNTSEPMRTYSGTEWNGLPGGSGDLAYPHSSSTLNLEKDGTLTTTFTLSYVRAGRDGAKSVTFSNVLLGYESWFDYTNIVSFYAWTPSLINVSSSGVLTLKDNNQIPRKVQAFVCGASSPSSAPTGYDKTSPSTGPKYLWANLKAGYEDIDVGSSDKISSYASTEQFAPFYMPNPGSATWVLYVAVRPAQASPWLRSAELTITFPAGVSTVGSTFTQTSSGVGSEFDISSNPNFVGDGQTVKVSAAHPGTIGTSGYVYLGYWTLPVASTSGLSGHISGHVVTNIRIIQSASYATCISGSCLTSKSGSDAVAGTANLHAGAVSRRRQLNEVWDYMGPLSPPKRRENVAPRRLQTCDPCTSAVYGDANGDCILRTDDAVEIIAMIGTRSAFQAGTESTDPLDNASSCEHTKLQHNPLYNLMDISSNTDDRYGKAEVGITDAVHVLRGTAGNARFIQPTIECVPSIDALGSRPDALIKSSVLAISPADSSTPTASVSSTKVYFDIVISGTPLPQYSPQFFNVTNGTVVTTKDTASLTETTSYAPAQQATQGTTAIHSVVVEAMFDQHFGQWVARVNPFGYEGDVHYHVAVVTESYTDSYDAAIWN